MVSHFDESGSPARRTGPPREPWHRSRRPRCPIVAVRASERRSVGALGRGVAGSARRPPRTPPLGARPHSALPLRARPPAGRQLGRSQRAASPAAVSDPRRSTPRAAVLLLRPLAPAPRLGGSSRPARRGGSPPGLDLGGARGEGGGRGLRPRRPSPARPRARRRRLRPQVHLHCCQQCWSSQSPARPAWREIARLGGWEAGRLGGWEAGRAGHCGAEAGMARRRAFLGGGRGGGHPPRRWYLLEPTFCRGGSGRGGVAGVPQGHRDRCDNSNVPRGGRLLTAYGCSPLLPAAARCCPLLPAAPRCCPLLPAAARCCPLLPAASHPSLSSRHPAAGGGGNSADLRESVGRPTVPEQHRADTPSLGAPEQSLFWGTVKSTD